MARSTSEKVGRGPCPDCGEAVVFRKSAGGMLCHKCENCDSSGYAEPGGEAYAKRMRSIATTYPKEAASAAHVEAKQTPPAAPAPTPAPAPKPKANSVFSLGAL
jgi:ssDNA-binding Zn-finger/Zn-ribbon topoisomerase 1